MSNDAVGSLYRNVIEGVISQAQIDFEDSGVDQQTIQELRSVWQQRLSALNVASMPWDPEESSSSASNNNNTNGIKTEDTGSVSNISTTATSTNLNNGLSASNSTSLSGGPIVPPTSSAAAGPILPDSSLDDSKNGGLVLPGGGITQTDGANDEDETDGMPLNRQQIDRIIAERAESIRRDDTTTINITKEGDRYILQTDGAASDQSDDINSDLDDPEDELASGDDEDDDEQGMIMLCLYDKVQRVKNKWKYVLKDGIANINGRDYVFCRGSGESEW